MSTDLARPEISVDNSLEIYPEFLRKLLLNRGITNLEEAQNFLEPDYENHLHDPYLLKDIEMLFELLHPNLSKSC